MASARTGARAKAVFLLRARNTPHRPKQASIEALADHRQGRRVDLDLAAAVTVDAPSAASDWTEFTGRRSSALGRYGTGNRLRKSPIPATLAIVGGGIRRVWVQNL